MLYNNIKDIDYIIYMLYYIFIVSNISNKRNVKIFQNLYQTLNEKKSIIEFVFIYTHKMIKINI